MPVGAYAVASDTGRRRRRNEDNYVATPPLFAVADGSRFTIGETTVTFSTERE